MANLTFLGMGLLGSGFAQRALEQGHTVTVWNRTPDKCAPLVARGARQASDPADAVRDADRVHLVLSEDHAVDAVIEALRPGLAPSVPIVDHSTNQPGKVAARFATLRSEGLHYLHLPVFMAPANARQGTGLMLASGPRDEIESLRPALETMTGELRLVGSRPDKAAALKLAGNGVLIMLTAAMGDLFKMGAGAGVSPEEVVGLFDSFSPSPAYMGRRALKASQGEASFELTMARKDTRLMIETAGGPDGLQVLPHVLSAIDAAIERGQGDRDFAIFAAPDADA